MIKMFRKIRKYVLAKVECRMSAEGIEFESSHVDLIGVYETDGKVYIDTLKSKELFLDLLVNLLKLFLEKLLGSKCMITQFTLQD